MKKKVFKAMSILMVAFMLLSACGTTPDGGDTPGTTGPDGAAPPGSSNQGPSVVVPSEDIPEVVTGVSDETLVVAAESEPPTLAPNFGIEPQSTTNIICDALNDSLIFTNSQTGQLEMSGTLTNVERIDEYSVRCFLRQGMVSYGGNTITAHDMVEVIKLTCEMSQGGTNYIMIDPDKVYAEDDYTFVMGTVNIYPTFTDLFAKYWIPALSMADINAIGGPDAVHRNPNVGCGKYFLDEWVPGQYLTLIRNDNYWNQDALPYYKYIKILFINDAATRAMALQAGDVDYVLEVQGPQVDGLANTPGLFIEAVPANTAISMFMNTSRPPFDDINFRKAFRMLIDFDGIIQIATYGYGQTAQTSFSRANLVYLRDYVNYPDGGPFVEEAKALLAQTSYNGETIYYNCEPPYNEMAQYIQACLLEGGINMRINIIEPASFQPMMASGDYDVVSNPVYGFDLARILNRYDGRVPTENASGGAQYRNDEEFFAIVDIARYELDDAIRRQAYFDVQQYVIDKCIMIGLYCNVVFNAHREGIRTAYHLTYGYAAIWSIAPLA